MMQHHGWRRETAVGPYPKPHPQAGRPRFWLVLVTWTCACSFAGSDLRNPIGLAGAFPGARRKYRLPHAEPLQPPNVVRIQPCYVSLPIPVQDRIEQ